MAEAVLLIGKATFAAAGLAAAVRLGSMARGASGMRQHGWACAMILLGGAGLLAFAISSAIGGPLGFALAVGGDLGERAALGLLCVFVWKVFRPEAGWAAALATLSIAALAATGFWELRVQALPDYDPNHPAAWLSQLVFAVPFAWSSAETALRFVRARRQARLGLSEPAVAHRFLLWSLACSAFVGICGLAILATLPGAPAAALNCARGLLYAWIAALVTLGFFAPKAYERRVARSAWLGAHSG
jgi:hypothetical protein